MGKKSDRYVRWGGWKALTCLFFCACCSTFNRSVCANEIPLGSSKSAPATVTSRSPLLYKIRQGTPQTPPSATLLSDRGAVELNAEQQEFDNKEQVIKATGNVTLRFNKALLTADRLRVDLTTKIAIAEGNVSLVRGQQILYGNKFEYNFEADKGSITEARGDIYQPTLTKDLNILPTAATPTTAGEKLFAEPTLSERLRNNQPITTIQNTSNIGVSVGSDRDIAYRPSLKSTGTINRVRFQADRVDFVADLITAEKLRITNDPFSPPEIQVKADRAEFKTVNKDEDEVVLSNPQVTIENSISIPVFKNRFVLNKLGKDPNPFNFGYDNDERGGVFFERSFYPVFDSKFRLTITPQYFIQRAITQLKPIDGSVLGVKANLEANLGPDTTLQASASVAGISINNFGDTARAKVGIKQNLNLFNYPYIATAEANYRERLFNGSLGYQDVQSSIGAVLSSPNIPLGNTGLNFNYQIGAQIITANTDRQNLLSSTRSNDLVTLSRYQAVGNLSRSFRLWEGQGLPADNKETYNYSPVPVVPYLQLNTGLSGVVSGYSNGDSPSSVGYNVGIEGQFGNFARSSFDYTGFNLNYFQRFQGNDSPFLFDRIVDNRVLSAGIIQQISGPFRLGIQTSMNLDSGRELSTDYYLQYSRRSYDLILRYNPSQQLGSLSFRLNDFNWDGVTPKF